MTTLWTIVAKKELGVSGNAVPKGAYVEVPVNNSTRKPYPNEILAVFNSKYGVNLNQMHVNNPNWLEISKK